MTKPVGVKTRNSDTQLSLTLSFDLSVLQLNIPEERYFLLGLLCGLAFYNKSVVPMPFPLALFKKLLDIKPSLDDLAELSPVIAQ